MCKWTPEWFLTQSLYSLRYAWVTFALQAARNQTPFKKTSAQSLLRVCKERHIAVTPCNVTAMVTQLWFPNISYMIHFIHSVQTSEAILLNQDWFDFICSKSSAGHLCEVNTGNHKVGIASERNGSICLYRECKCAWKMSFSDELAEKSLLFWFYRLPRIKFVLFVTARGSYFQPKFGIGFVPIRPNFLKTTKISEKKPQESKNKVIPNINLMICTQIICVILYW